MTTTENTYRVTAKRPADDYKHVKINWDEDYDGRIFLFLKDLEHEHLLDELVECGEREGGLSLVWKSNIPEKYRVDYYDNGYEPGDGDYWSIVESVTLDKLV